MSRQYAGLDAPRYEPLIGKSVVAGPTVGSWAILAFLRGGIHRDFTYPALKRQGVLSIFGPCLCQICTRRNPLQSSLPMKTFEQIVELEKQYLLGTYNRYPVAFTRGKGVFLFDLENKRYLDFVSGLGVNALGHAHPRIVKTIREQAAKLIHISNLYYHEYQGALAEKLCILAGGSIDGSSAGLSTFRAFFQNSGTE